MCKVEIQALNLLIFISHNMYFFHMYQLFFLISYLFILFFYYFATLWFVVMGIKGRRVHMIEELSETIISFQRGKPCLHCES